MSRSAIPDFLLPHLALFGAGSETLRVGDDAPDFVLPGSDGVNHSLAQYRDRQAVVLAWFPRAFTPG